MRFLFLPRQVASLLFLFFCFAAHAQTISISGAVLKPGEYQWQAGARLRDAIVAGQVRADAWPQGAALLRRSAVEPQQRLKAGVLFDLRTNLVHARSEADPALEQLLGDMLAFVEPLPVTGRVTAELTPFQLLVKGNNALLEAGDRLLYPQRPDSVRVLGAVDHPCQLLFDAALDIQDYVNQCPTHARADRNHIYLIQPDGAVEQVGMAHWNEQQAYIAVGGILYVPIDPRVLAEQAQALNPELARLLATQYDLGGRFSE